MRIVKLFAAIILLLLAVLFYTPVLDGGTLPEGRYELPVSMGSKPEITCCFPRIPLFQHLVDNLLHLLGKPRSGVEHPVIVPA